MYVCSCVFMYVCLYVYVYIYCHITHANIQRTEQKLQSTESTHGIPLCWTANSQEYIDTKAISNSKEKHNFKKRMISEARERWFLLRLKSRYAG